MTEAAAETEGGKRRVKWWSEECDKEAFEESSQMLGLLSSAPSEPLRIHSLVVLFERRLIAQTERKREDYKARASLEQWTFLKAEP
ncbi:hypothetical protein PAMP_000945 [Pampus punctatissimus]